MISLLINNLEVPIPDDFQITLTTENPFFSSATSYSGEIGLDAKTCCRIFGPSWRLDVSHRQIVKDCVLRINNVPLRGTATTISYTDTTVSVQLLFGNSAIKFKASLGEIYIDNRYYGTCLDNRCEYDSNGNKLTTIVTERTWNGLQSWIQRVALTANGIYQECMNDPDERDWVMLPATDGTDIYNKWIYHRNLNNAISSGTDSAGNGGTRPYYDDGNYTIYEGGTPACAAYVPQPRLLPLIRRIINSLGYTVTRFDAEDTAQKYLYYPNVTKTIYWHQMLPHWTYSNFITYVENFLGSVFLFDTTNKECQIISRRAWLNEVVIPLVQVNDAYKAEISDADTSDISDSNLKYNFTYDKLHCLSEAVFNKSNLEVVDTFNATTYVSELIRYDGKYYYWSRSALRYKRCNELGALIRDKDNSYIELNIVPAKMEVINSHIVTGYETPEVESDYAKCQRGITTIALVAEAATANREANLSDYLEEDAEDVENSLDVMPVGIFRCYYDVPWCISQWIVNTATTQQTVTTEYYSRHFGWTYDHDDITDDCVSDSFTFDPCLNLIEMESQDTIYSEGLDPSLAIDTETPIEMEFYDDLPDIFDLNKTFIIRGHQYVAEKIEMIIDKDGIRKSKKGTFYQIGEQSSVNDDYEVVITADYSDDYNQTVTPVPDDNVVPYETNSENARWIFYLARLIHKLSGQEVTPSSVYFGYSADSMRLIVPSAMFSGRILGIVRMDPGESATAYIKLSFDGSSYIGTMTITRATS